MKIIIVSDSHGEYKILESIYLKNQDADIFIHLGDYELPEYLMSRYLYIKGNCDFLSDAPVKKDVEYNGLKFHLEHGDRLAFSNFSEYIKSLNCDVFLFGHTHKKFEKYIDNILVLNPGSLTRPRDGNKGSYLILTIDKQKNIKYEFKEIENGL